LSRARRTAAITTPTTLIGQLIGTAATAHACGLGGLHIVHDEPVSSGWRR